MAAALGVQRGEGHCPWPRARQHRLDPGGRRAGPDAALRWLDAELPNLICSVHQASAAGQHEIAWKLATALWDVFTLRGHWASWIDSHEVALRSARATGDRGAEAWICSNLGTACTRTGQIKSAIDHLTCALEARETGNVTSEAAVLGNPGNAHQELGQLPEALDLYEQSLSISKVADHTHSQCLMLLNIAEVRQLLGQHGGAAQCYRDSLELRVGDDRLDGIALSGLGDVSVSLGSSGEAAGYYQQALEVHRRTGDRPSEMRTLEALATALDSTGQRAAAQQHRFEAGVLRGELDQPPPAS